MHIGRLAIVAALVVMAAFSGPATAGKPPTTNLLYPYLTNQGGLDTVFTISNTGADPFGTQSAGGSCTVTFFSGGVGETVIIPGILLPGQTADFVLSVIQPRFQGYAIATCSIPFAHGVARVSDVGARNFATSYPALVLPNKRAKTDERLSE